jgi:putative nucleotidyltransferase domain protein (fragment)
MRVHCGSFFAVCLSKTTVYVKIVDNDFISLYMSRFDTLYKHGRMEKLMPAANRKHIEEIVLKAAE